MLRCHHCNAPADHLCDYVLGAASDDGFIHLDSEIITCSRPVCDECRTVVAVSFDIHGPGTVETRDLCRDHAAENEELKPIPLHDLLVTKRRLQLRSIT